MVKEYLSIKEISLHLGLKKSSIYARVESGDIPHYKIGRLIRFKKDDIDTWMEGHRVRTVSPDRKARRVLKVVNNSHLDIGGLVKKTIAEVKKNGYSARQGRPDRIRGLGKEVEYGTF